MGDIYVIISVFLTQFITDKDVASNFSKYKAYLNVDKASMFSPESTHCIQSMFDFCTYVNPQGCTHRQASGNTNTVMHITCQDTAIWLKRSCPVTWLMSTTKDRRKTFYPQKWILRFSSSS